MEKGEESRVAVKAEIKKKKKDSASKKAKRKYKALAEGKRGDSSTGGSDEADESTGQVWPHSSHGHDSPEKKLGLANP